MNLIAKLLSKLLSKLPNCQIKTKVKEEQSLSLANEKINCLGGSKTRLKQRDYSMRKKKLLDFISLFDRPSSLLLSSLFDHYYRTK